MTTANRSDDDGLLAALRHPLRRRILRTLAGEEALSPRQLAGTLGAPLSNVAYHVRVLAECAAVVLVRTRPAHGSMEHFYATAVEAPWALQILDQSEGEDEDAGESSGGTGT
jgi:DNA-binding transcriptional ArsR family regulator